MPSGRGRPFDLVANRALLFVILTGFGVAAYALTVAVVGPVVPFKGAAAVLFGGASAAVLLFVRDWAQRGVDWLLYGDRNDPHRALLRVGRELASAADPAGLVPILAETIAESLRLSFFEVVFFDHPASLSVGQRPNRVTEQPLIHQGRTIGLLRAGRRGEQLSRSDRRLIGGVAPQLAAAAETLRLHESLSAARERIVRAREEERRRLRSDLHDVLGPALAGVGLGIEAARARARRDPTGADELLADVQGEVRDAVTQMRRIVDGLRPPALDEMGLAAAISHQAGVVAQRCPQIRVAVDVPQLPALPAAVEVVAYLITQ
jgi:signal transduction histidine kinase